ncbi:PHP domain-containing protein [Serinicoccus sp. LYQ131]|uniref:PHP domain-containing protein n=1 Tax=Serinicoccus sp. LYQ131 TaxID=3378797 RepID=UPI0038535A7E
MPRPPLDPDARIDLHTHSDRSDGTESPAVLVREAAAAGLDVVALTDHDGVSGWAEADRAGRRHKVVVVPGVEISCSWHGVSVHLLGYLVDPGHPGLTEELGRTRESRRTRLRRMVELLAAEGFPVSYPEVLALAGDEASLGRPHIADVLVGNGRYASRDEAFADVLASGSPFHVGHYAPGPVHATELVRAAGGVAVMAHPFAAARGTLVPDAVIGEMARAGLLGLEVEHRDHDPEQRAHGRELARRLGLLTTGSSDYHGAGKPNRLGENLTDPEVLDAILGAGSGHPLLGDSG